MSDKPEPITINVDHIDSSEVVMDMTEPQIPTPPPVEFQEVNPIVWPEKTSDAIIIQSCVPTHGPFDEALEWLKPIHSTYAEKWKMDYVANSSVVVIPPEDQQQMFSHAWDKIPLIMEAIKRGYENIFWIDHDCVIVDFNVDLRIAFDRPDKFIYMCVHPGFPSHGLPSHFNAGVMAVKGNPITEEFFNIVWANRYSGPPWFEQDVMNRLFTNFTWMQFVEVMSDRFNSTPNANEVPIDLAVIAAFHGQGGYHDVNTRLDMMKKAAEHRKVEQQIAKYQKKK